MSEKTFGQVACEAVHPHWKAQCEQKPILQLPSAEKIAEAIYSIYGDKWPNASDHDKSICMREAEAVLDLLQAKQSAPTCNIQATSEDLNECLCDESVGFVCSAHAKEQDEETKPGAETEDQYQSRLLRALRSFG